ncbi:smoothelin isoform X2 [Pungitius pungitius]|uniref:smoothelin isoform X2 n=1 Tax=Pungitius pungitius TaxID=134920 RepID=UPI002E0D8825
MSAQSYSALDESSLRALLEGTVDLDERRLIRSAIRELRMREIEDMEAALATKRFRPTRLKQQEDKENLHRPECNDLDVLSRDLRSVQDIDELTKMLRAASEYEERKMIRAAIRQLRDEQQGTVERAKAPGRCPEPDSVEPQIVMATEETGDIRESRGQRTQPGTELQRRGSGMVLDNGPEPLLIPPQREAGTTESDLSQRSDSWASDRSGTSGSSLHAVCSAYRPRLDSGASDRSQSPSPRGRLDSGASERSLSAASCARQRLGSDVSDSGASERCVSASSEERGPVEEEAEVATSGSTYSEIESGRRRPASPRAASNQEQPDGAALSGKEPSNGLLNGSTKGEKDFQTQKMTNRHGKATDSALEKKDVVEHFNRNNSVRDRMRKFTEASQGPNVPALKNAPLRNGTTSGSRGETNLSTHTAASLCTSGGRPAGPRVDSASRDSAASQNGAIPQPRGVANRPPSTASQWEDSMGGTRHPAEKDVHVSRNSKEDETQGRAAGQQVTQGEEDPDMKTFLTIEIKEGRTTASSTSPSRSNMVPTPNTTPRIATNALGQRAELTFGLRATPFKISSSSLSSGSSIKVEKEQVVAPEPVFSAGPSPLLASHVPAVPKLTAQQLAAIEDEEVLDKMLDESKDFEERKMIRAAMRDLRKRKREAMLGCTQEELDQREKERETRLQELRQQKGRAGLGAGELLVRKVEKSADGSTLSQVTKTDRFASSDDGSKSTRSTVFEASYVKKTDRGTVQSKSYSFSSSTSSSSNTTKKVGSVFDREDDTSSRGGSGGLAALERKQAERRKELMRAQTLPKTSAMQARKAMIEKLEKEGGGPGNQAVAKVNKVQRSTSFGVPNANSIKQMLLDWCRAKTRSYEHVDIQNFSSSWSNGMAFCALVHNFFPESFDYDSLSPSNRRQNFEVAFSTAEKLVDCPQLLDVDDMVKLREPDWKCVYTYLQEFYRGLVTKGLVKTKNSS